MGYVGADGFPVVTPVTVGDVSEAGIRLSGGELPGGGRRAGVMGHRYRSQLVGLAVRQHTGWLQDGVYAPHTESGFRAPSNKTILLLANGYMARRGLKRAQRVSPTPYGRTPRSRCPAGAAAHDGARPRGPRAGAGRASW